jgi:predicted amidophosphoribosyltransferase
LSTGSLPGMAVAGAAGHGGPVRDAFSDLLLGGRCAGCGEPGRILCADCTSSLPRRGHPVRPEPAPPGLPPVLAAGEYADLLRRLVLDHKERHAFGLARPLGRVLAAVLADVAAGAPAGPAGTLLVLVPVPSAPASTRKRGHDPVLRMTRVAARTLSADGRSAVVARLLRIAQPVLDQAGLDSAARAANLSGRLAVRASAHRVLARTVQPVQVLLCDDVLTTGATLAEAQRALASVGLPAVAAATLAATRRRLPARPGGPGSG